MKTLTAILLSFTCILAAEEDIPEWAVEIPFEEGVLFGIGSVDSSLDNAHGFSRDVAFGAIAAQLNTTLEQNRESTQENIDRITTLEESGNPTKEMKLHASHRTAKRSIKTETRLPFLPGAKVIKQEVSGKQVFTLARLETANFANLVIARVKELDALMAAAPAAATDANSAWALRQAASAAMERDFLRTLAAGASIDIGPSVPSPEELIKRCGLLMEPLVFRVEGGSGETAAEDALGEMAPTLGISLADAQTDTPFAFNVSERVRSRQIDGWTRSTVTSTITITHRPTGRKTGQLRKVIEKSSTMGEADAVDRARSVLIDEMIQEIETKFFTLLANTPLTK